MSLIFKEDYNLISEIGKKKIYFKRWTAKEEKEYLKLVEEQKDLNDEVIYNILIKPCIKDKNINLSSAEQRKLLIDIRIASINENIIDTKICPSCNSKEEINFKIKDYIKYIESKYEPIEVEGIIFELTNEIKKELKKKLDINKGLVNYVFTDFLIHIDKIKMNEEIHKDFKWKELNDFIDSLPTSIFDKVFEEYQNQVDKTEIIYPFKCKKCNYKEDIEYQNIPNFLWI